MPGKRTIARRNPHLHNRRVSVEVLKQELAALGAEQRREIVGFLIGLNRSERYKAYQREMSDRLDAKGAPAWATLAEADARLDWLPDPE